MMMHDHALQCLHDHVLLLVTAQLTPGRGLFSGGAEAYTVQLKVDSLQSVVRSLRTTDCKISGRNATVWAFAPPQKNAI